MPFPKFGVSQFSRCLLAAHPVLATCVGTGDQKQREMVPALKDERHKAILMHLSAQEDFTVLFSCVRDWVRFGGTVMREALWSLHKCITTNRVSPTKGALTQQ